MNEWVKCQTCDGTGIFKEYPCPKCLGLGRLQWINNLVSREAKCYPVYLTIDRDCRFPKMKSREQFFDYFRKLKEEKKIFNFKFLDEFRNDSSWVVINVFPNLSNDFYEFLFYLGCG